jgi:hypothetical protein
MFLAAGAAALGLFFGPIGAALARRIAGRPPRDAAQAEIARVDERITSEVDELRSRMAEVEERLDFAERLLARGGQADQIPGGVQR